MNATVGGYRPGLVARRLHERSKCVCCGAAGLWRVNVEAVTDGRRTTVDVCERCLRAEGASWLLRWRPVPVER
jgi:predicted SPOUT superfamily RNA methylase MTH1